MLAGDLINKAVEEIKKDELFDDFSKHEVSIMAVLREVAQTETKLQKAVGHSVMKHPLRILKNILSSIISQHWVDLIEKALLKYIL